MLAKANSDHNIAKEKQQLFVSFGALYCTVEAVVVPRLERNEMDRSCASHAMQCNASELFLDPERFREMHIIWTGQKPVCCLYKKGLSRNGMAE